MMRGPWQFTPEYVLYTLYPITDGESIIWKGKLDLLNKTNIKIVSLSEDLENYINSKSSDYNF
jgi:exopolysaccharide biosynthesis predicted pyruvyltransferase EpsI